MSVAAAAAGGPAGEEGAGERDGEHGEEELVVDKILLGGVALGLEGVDEVGAEGGVYYGPGAEARCLELGLVERGRGGAPGGLVVLEPGEKGGEGYVAQKSKVKLVPRTRWQPN